MERNIVRIAVRPADAIDETTYVTRNQAAQTNLAKHVRDLCLFVLPQRGRDQQISEPGLESQERPFVLIAHIGEVMQEMIEPEQSEVQYTNSALPFDSLFAFAIPLLISLAFLSSAETVRISRHFTNGLEAKSLDLTCEGTFPVSGEVAICFKQAPWRTLKLRVSLPEFKSLHSRVIGLRPGIRTPLTNGLTPAPFPDVVFSGAEVQSPVAYPWSGRQAYTITLTIY
ncbi:small conductance calcium-activated potassiumchannel protein 1 [Striga asiatica]|uniref:Small conductance calcium-activated potassiumchannel protein 1 n=1 Tax=Striga asiatica TaxID=4170 RepID=A0A5A7QTE4_STRAF|nr:small conductance calcium-activated potassiumchannel protein 1 [Striga asiatica]